MFSSPVPITLPHLMQTDRSFPYGRINNDTEVIFDFMGVSNHYVKHGITAVITDGIIEGWQSWVSRHEQLEVQATRVTGPYKLTHQPSSMQHCSLCHVCVRGMNKNSYTISI